jgi:hypothetical protein
VFHSIAEGEAWKGLVVACFDCGKPGGQDWVTGGRVVETDKSADARKVIRAGGLGGCGGRWQGMGLNARVGRSGV